MKCFRCGCEMPPENKFCTNCGARLDSSSNTPKKEAKPLKILLIVLLISIAIVSVVFVGIYFVVEDVIENSEYSYDENYYYDYSDDFEGALVEEGPLPTI